MYYYAPLVRPGRAPLTQTPFYFTAKKCEVTLSRINKNI